MRKISTLLTATFFVITVWAQTPEKMSYQAVIRNSSNQLISNQTVGMQISILQDSLNGTVAYTETQTPKTNANGLLSIAFGGGTGFSKINWATRPYFIKTETDPTGGTNYSITGVNQILSAPYALFAKKAKEINGNSIPLITQNEWANLFPVTVNWGYWTVIARAHGYGYTEKYHEWRVIVGDFPGGNVFFNEVSNIGNSTYSAELRVNNGYIQGRWTGTIDNGGAFCIFYIQFNSLNF